MKKYIILIICILMFVTAVTVIPVMTAAADIEVVGTDVTLTADDDSDDELAIESINGEVIIGNYCKSYYNYYCEYCDEFFQL